MRRNPEKGLTMIELLLVLTIISILAALAIVNYFNALTRAKLKRTMADMRTIAVAWEARAADAQSYSAAGFSFPSTPVTYEDMTTMLVPTYTKQLPRTDGWDRPLEFAVSGTPSTFYGIRAPGRDGIFDATYPAPGVTSDPDCDIVYANGQFLIYPDVAVADK